MPGRYALIVTTDTYSDPRLRRLRAPAQDAHALEAVLQDPEIGDFHVERLSNQPEAVVRRRIAAFFSEREPDDLLLVHFSCHGLKDDGGQLFFAAADTEVAQLDATAITAEFVARQMTRSRSKKVLLLLDCCYSGAFARGFSFRAGDDVDVHDHLDGSGRAIITASNAMEYAFEGEELTGEGRPSVFTGAVVEALRTGEADRDQDSHISVQELYDYVCDTVRNVTPGQRPNLLSHLEGELYVARSRWVAPAELPEDLLRTLESPYAAVREGAVAALAQLLADRRLANHARARLEEVAANDDSRRVSTAAAAALAPAEDAARGKGDDARAKSSPAAVGLPRWDEPSVATGAAAKAPPRPGTASRPFSTAGRRLSPRNVAVFVVAVVTLVAWALLPWAWTDEPVPLLSGADLPDAGKGAFIAIALAAILVACLAFARRPRAELWLAAMLLSAAGLGTLVAWRDYDPGAELEAGAVIGSAGVLVLLAIALGQSASRYRPNGRRLPERAAALGGVLLVVAALVFDRSENTGTIAIAAVFAAGGVTLTAAAIPAVPTVVAAAAGTVALFADTFAGGRGLPLLLAGAGLALVGGVYSFGSRESSATDARTARAAGL